MENTKKLQDISRSDLKKDQMGENNLKNLALANFEKAFYIYESNSSISDIYIYKLFTRREWKRDGVGRL